MPPLYQSTIAELRKLLSKKTISPKDILLSLKERIDSVDPLIAGYLHIDLEEALKKAEEADLSLPLGGIPIAIKDLLNVSGQPLTCASKILDQKYTAPYHATAIEKLLQSGAIAFGRTNMDEFAMGSSCENSGLKITKNPWDTSRAPGGSSGGSAAVVAANEAIAALGTDTGGSIRQPASFCGIVGLKPTYGRVSRYGLVAFASSLDQIGPMTKTVEDSALVLQAISGFDPMDSTSLKESVPNYSLSLKKSIKGLRIGMPTEYFSEGIDPRVKETVEKAAKHLQDLGAEIIELSLPHTEQAVAVYYVIATAEASANLARFDGVRYGHRTENIDGLFSHYTRTREEGFGEEVKRRILLGTYVLSSGYYDAYYLRAQKIRSLIREDFHNAFQKVDLLLSPTSPTPAFSLGERTSDPLQMYLADIFTIATNLAGNCAISLPCGFIKENDKKLPVGLQFIAPPFQEERLFNTAFAYEQSTPWHQEQSEL